MAGKDWLEAEYRAEKANELLEAHRLEEALHELEVAVDINPHNASWQTSLGKILDDMKRYDQAAECIRACIANRTSE